MLCVLYGTVIMPAQLTNTRADSSQQLCEHPTDQIVPLELAAVLPLKLSNLHHQPVRARRNCQKLSKSAEKQMEGTRLNTWQTLHGHFPAMGQMQMITQNENY